MNPSDTEVAAPLTGVSQALNRAAKRARIVAAQTRTPLVISENGQIKRHWIDFGSAPWRREDVEHYLTAAPDVTPAENDQIKQPE